MAAECGSDEELCHQFLWRAVTKCTALHWTALHWTALHCTALHCSTVGVHWQLVAGLGEKNVSFFCPYLFSFCPFLLDFPTFHKVPISHLQYATENGLNEKRRDYPHQRNSCKLQKSIRKNPPSPVSCQGQDSITSSRQQCVLTWLYDCRRSAGPLQHLLTSLRCRLQLPGAATQPSSGWNALLSSAPHPRYVDKMGREQKHSHPLALMTSHRTLLPPMAHEWLGQFVIVPLK